MEAFGAPIAPWPPEAWLAHAVPWVDALGQPRGVRVVVATPRRPNEASTIAFPTGLGLVVADFSRPVVALFARLAVDAGRVIATPDANAPTFQAAEAVEASTVGLHLWIEIALVCVSEAFAFLTLVASDKFALPPHFLIVHRTALVAQRPAGVVLAFALIFLEMLVTR